MTKILEKLEKISRYDFRLEISPRSNEIYVRVKSSKVSRNKKKLFKYTDGHLIDPWLADLRKQATAKKKRKAKVKEKRKKETGTSIDYEKKAIDAFQARCRYRCALRDNNSIHRGYCCTSGKPTATNSRSHKYYKPDIPNLQHGHAGHGCNRQHKNLILYEKNCHLQCAIENKNQGGRFPKSYQDFIVRIYGQKELDNIMNLKEEWEKKRHKKQTQLELKKVYIKYKNRLKKMGVFETRSGYFPKEYLGKSKIIS